MTYLDSFSDRVRLMITDQNNYWIDLGEHCEMRNVLSKNLTHVELDWNAFQRFREDNKNLLKSLDIWSNFTNSFIQCCLEASHDKLMICEETSPMLLTRKSILLLNGRSYCVIQQTSLSGKSQIQMNSNGGFTMSSSNIVEIWFPDTPEDRVNISLIKLSI